VVIREVQVKETSGSSGVMVQVVHQEIQEQFKRVHQSKWIKWYNIRKFRKHRS
jgi:hypothetical protein